MPTLALTLSYNGAPFCGFARQKTKVPTVQGSLERALEMVFKRPVETVCAGRTDTGVHALGQVVSFGVTEAELRDRTDHALLRSFNALTDDAIAVRRIDRVPDGFSARFDAQWREYRYFLYEGPGEPLVMRDFSWHVPGSLDVEAMRSAAAHLVGEHDFKSFCVAESAEGKPTRRNVMELQVDPCCIMGDSLVSIKVVGNAFLHSMVRTMVGTLVMVGRGKRPPEWTADVLAACDRQAAGEKAPAEGLVFWHVAYEGLQ